MSGLCACLCVLLANFQKIHTRRSWVYNVYMGPPSPFQTLFLCAFCFPPPSCDPPHPQGACWQTGQASVAAPSRYLRSWRLARRGGEGWFYCGLPFWPICSVRKYAVQILVPIIFRLPSVKLFCRRPLPSNRWSPVARSCFLFTQSKLGSIQTTANGNPLGGRTMQEPPDPGHF